MMDFLFFVKTLILTLAIVMVMQIQVGQKSLETHAMSFVQSSTVAAPLHGIARGAAQVVHDLSHSVTGFIHHNVNKNKKEDGRLRRESSIRSSHSSKDSQADED
jgi:hypothetical protein